MASVPSTFQDHIDHESPLLEGKDNGHYVGLTRRAPLITRHFAGNTDPLDDVEWELRTATISGENGEKIFEQTGIEAPKGWSQLAVNVVASKYFRGKVGTPERETSIRKLIHRVVGTIVSWGVSDGYFADGLEACVFAYELDYLLVHQLAAFNSPVWFNVGVEEKPQCSACFILKVEDNMDSILEWYRQEGIIFKHGSGAGVNISALRSKRESLSSGGRASGPLSFMKAADASAGVIKSGGKTRRAAKMVVMNADHPDIMDFIWCKRDEEMKARALEKAGYSGGIDGEAVGSVAFQNANNSVRVSNAFMQAIEDRTHTPTKLVTTGEIAEMLYARDIFASIAEAAHECGDPGLQFDDTINAWHTCPGAGRINASNPCSEYMHLDNSACNLASLNLLRFHRNGEFDVAAFKHAVDVMITAQDIIVDRSSYPTPEIARNAHNFRQLGLGYANLGATLMMLGMPYDSDQGRDYAAAITALMTGEAYLQSARIAERRGVFTGCEDATLRIVEKHAIMAMQLRGKGSLVVAARAAWNEAVQAGQLHGYRNSQATVIAPTGTIAFMMDCDTTGIEPDIALVKYKKLVGGGQMKIVNTTVGEALRRLEYDRESIKRIEHHIVERETIEGCASLRPEHLPIFDCAFKPRNGERSIHWRGHIEMMAAVQPFISGAISKTVNMPADATVVDVEDAFMLAWKLGLKAIAIYRDGSKTVQPLNTSKDAGVAQTEEQGFRKPQVGSSTLPAGPTPQRRKLPNERQAVTKKFNIAGHEGYITVGMFEDGSPGELFVKMSKQGSTIAGLMDAFAIAVSFALQYGVPLDFLVKKYTHLRFEPAGFSGEEWCGYAQSPVDYVFRWLEHRFLKSALQLIEEKVSSEPEVDIERVVKLFGGAQVVESFVNQLDAPPCSDCGCIMVRNGACYKCLNCGATSGCS